jgi:hypothetical protein
VIDLFELGTKALLRDINPIGDNHTSGHTRLIDVLSNSSSVMLAERIPVVSIFVRWGAVRPAPIPMIGRLLLTIEGDVNFLETAIMLTPTEIVVGLWVLIEDGTLGH